MNDNLPYHEAVAVERLRVEITTARKIADSNWSQPIRDDAKATADLLAIAVELLEVPFHE